MLLVEGAGGAPERFGNVGVTEEEERAFSAVVTFIYALVFFSVELLVAVVVIARVGLFGDHGVGQVGFTGVHGLAGTDAGGSVILVFDIFRLCKMKSQL